MGAIESRSKGLVPLACRGTEQRTAGPPGRDGNTTKRQQEGFHNIQTGTKAKLHVCMPYGQGRGHGEGAGAAPHNQRKQNEKQRLGKAGQSNYAIRIGGPIQIAWLALRADPKRRKAN